MAPIGFLIRFSPFFHLLYATAVQLTSPERKGILKKTQWTPEKNPPKNLIGTFFSRFGPWRQMKINNWRKNRLATLPPVSPELPEKQHVVPFKLETRWRDSHRKPFEESGGLGKLFGSDMDLSREIPFFALPQNRRRQQEYADLYAGIISDFYRVGKTQESAQRRAARIKTELANLDRIHWARHLIPKDPDHRSIVVARPDDVGNEAYSVMRLEFREREYMKAMHSVARRAKWFNDVGAKNGASRKSKTMQNLRGFLERKANRRSRYTSETIPRYVLLFNVKLVDAGFDETTDNVRTHNLIFVKRNDGRSFTLNDLKKLDWAKDMVQSLVDSDSV